MLLVSDVQHHFDGELIQVSTSRFRPNLVVCGGEAYAEDGWRSLRIGKTEFIVSCSSDFSWLMSSQMLNCTAFLTLLMGESAMLRRWYFRRCYPIDICFSGYTYNSISFLPFPLHVRLVMVHFLGFGYKFAVNVHPIDRIYNVIIYHLTLVLHQVSFLCNL